MFSYRLVVITWLVSWLAIIDWYVYRKLISHTTYQLVITNYRMILLTRHASGGAARLTLPV